MLSSQIVLNSMAFPLASFQIFCIVCVLKHWWIPESLGSGRASHMFPWSLNNWRWVSSAPCPWVILTESRPAVSHISQHSAKLFHSMDLRKNVYTLTSDMFLNYNRGFSLERRVVLFIKMKKGFYRLFITTSEGTRKKDLPWWSNSWESLRAEETFPVWNNEPTLEQCNPYVILQTSMSQMSFHPL